MKSRSDFQTWNTRHRANQLKFALVIEEAGDLRDSLLALLRGHGWLVHGVTRAEETFGILAHIPYSLIVLDSELPGICAIDFARILRNSKEWQTIRLVVINSSDSAGLESQITEAGVFLARRSMWEDDLNVFLIADERDSRISINCS
jgi:CheY-like chemotaxis protein